MSAMISIDFGNSYTKVGIRQNQDEPTEPLTDDSLSLDELNMCVPTLAACRSINGTQHWVFGTDVMQYQTDSPNLTVYRNWKPCFFRGVETRLEKPVKRAVQAVSKSDADQFSSSPLSEDQWQKLKEEGVPEAARQAIEAVIQQKRPEEASESEEPVVDAGSAEETDLDVKEVGVGFFRWLREELVEPVCQKRGLGSVSDLPARITLPSFGTSTKAEYLLEAILREAGWRPAERLPALAEPHANAIGIFTEGMNATHEPGPTRMPHYGKMFEQTGLRKVIREAALYDGPKVSWVMVVDLGGYTADFSMMGLDLEDIDGRLEGEIEGLPQAARFSEPIGVTTLDKRIVEVLGEPQRGAFSALERDPDQRRLETFHRNVYGGKRPVYRLRRGVTIGQGKERQEIAGSVDEFAEEIADCAEKFMEMHQYYRIDDLILTGGGCMIAAVRRALQNRLEPYGVRKTHHYVEPSASVEDRCHRLDRRLVRGATAIGGASVYFDFAE